MSRLSLFCIVVILGCLGCQRAPSTAVVQQAATQVPTAEEAVLADYIVGQPLSYENLTIFPLSSTEPKHEDRYITLDEGLKSGTVEILEMGVQEQLDETSSNEANPHGGGEVQVTDEPLEVDAGDSPRENLAVRPGGGNQVNQLMVVNRSDKTLYLMPGEIIVGGSQDRTIGQELVVQPDGKPVPINVYCVEHGRWGQRPQAATVAALNEALSNGANADSISLAATDGGTIDAAAEVANKGKFVAGLGQLSKDVRYAVQATNSQGEVWDQVAKENAKSGVQSSSGTFSRNYVVTKNIQRLQPYIDNLHEPVGATEDIVGVIVAVNGNVEIVDAFASTPLFKKLWPKLLKSYALDAANAVDGENASDKCPPQRACEFLAEALKADIEETKVDRGIAVTRRRNSRSVTFSASYEACGGCACCCCCCCSGFGGVHTSVLAVE